jgi:hypothetical protein
LGISAILLFPTYHGEHVDAVKAGQFGDFIGGYFGTVFLIVSVALLLGSYKNQRSTNERTAFESRFFELLKYHRENVAEIGIGEKTGRRVFVSMIREFRETLVLVRAACAELGADRSQRENIDLAYQAFYYGVSPNSSRVLWEAVSPDHPDQLVTRVIATMEDTQKQLRQPEKKLTVLQWIVSRLFSEVESSVSATTRLSYCPFDGHQSRLGHYFRHLYQTVKYANDNAPRGKAEEYVDLLRAQLTNHEQALFCLNALSRVGSTWVARGYLEKFEMIKNIPHKFFNPQSELDLLEEFPKIKFEFMNLGAPNEPNR